jgi:hypothetical protein
MDENTKATLQLVWGLLLAMAGIGLFFRIPQVMPQIRQIESFSGAIPFIYFCLYFMAVFLIAGGGRKIYLNSRKLKSGSPPPR